MEHNTARPIRDRTALTTGGAISDAPAGRFGSVPHEPPPRDEPFPEAWLAHLQTNVFPYRLLSDAEQTRLRQAIRRFIAAKFWEGCAGLRLTEEMQVTIAGQACLLVLGFDGYCFEEQSSILVYPSGYLGQDMQEDSDRPMHRLGEAHARGPVVLSWWHARWGGRYWYRHNLVLHEFAHKLAEMGDPHTGLPPIDDPRQVERWQAVMAGERRQLVADAAYGRPTLLDPYGASSPPEFFAVASECFFLRPLALGQRHPELYQWLAGWYRQDPAAWRVDEAAREHAAAAEEEDLHHTLAECDAILARFPNYLSGYRQRAECWSALGEFDNALADCTRLVELSGKKNKAVAYCTRGWINGEAGREEEALEDFSEAIRLRSDLADAYCGRGSVYAQRGEFRRAIVDLTRALQLDPEDDTALRWRAYVHGETGKYARALRDLDRAIRLCPHGPEGYFDRGQIHLRQKNYDRAIADFSAAILRDADDADAYLARAEAFEVKGQPADAARDRARAEQIQGRTSRRATPRREGILPADAPSLVGLRPSPRK